MNRLWYVLIGMMIIFPAFSILALENSAKKSVGSADYNYRMNKDFPVFPSFRKQYMVEMRDGILLATDVYRPIFRGTPHGAILMRTPYNKDELAAVGCVFAWIGWPMVIQDMRGRFASEGNYSVFLKDNTDGQDTLAWIANQSWSNGKIVTMGPSALGIPQYCMAGENPSNLVGQFIIDATPNLYKDAVFQGGQLRYSLVTGWLDGQGSLDLLNEILVHENFSSTYWANVSLQGKWNDVNVPAIHMGGWYDIFIQGIIDGFKGYQYQGGNGARGNSKLIIGPWTHVGSISREQGDFTYPYTSLGFFGLRLFRKMLIQYAKDGSNGYDSWPPVSYYVMGAVDERGAPGNEWRYAERWPIPTINRSWFFYSDGSLNVVPPSDNAIFSYEYDPLDPVPTIGGQNLNIMDGPYDQRMVEGRDDVIVFTSSVLEQPYESTGLVKARLFVSSDCADTDFSVKLSDVYPDGRSMLITDSILRMRNRNGSDHWEFMNLGEIYKVEVDLLSTSYIWNVGHRIRVAVSSSNYPRFLNNPNTASGILQNESFVVANNSLYVGSIYPSALILSEI
jgi:predicted acyl esterase